MHTVSMHVCVFMCRKRSSKWDKRPETVEKSESGGSDDPIPAKRERRSTKSKWDKLPDTSNWDKGPSESKWDIRPEDVVEQDSSSASDSHAATSVAGGCGLVAAAEAAARVNAMLMAKGTLKTAEPLLVNNTILKSKPAVSEILRSDHCCFSLFVLTKLCFFNTADQNIIVGPVHVSNIILLIFDNFVLHTILPYPLLTVLSTHTLSCRL